jgi:hypothetical protein
MRLEVLTAVSMNVTVLWDTTPCRLVEIYQLIALIMEAVGTSETSVNLYQTTWRGIPEDSHLHCRCRSSRF